MLKKIIVIVLLPCLLCVSFKAGYKSLYRVPLNAYSVAASDIDMDGDQDIIIEHSYSSLSNWGGVSIIENDNQGSFLLKDSLFFAYGLININIEKLDKNDFPDIFGQHITNDTAPINNRFISVIYNYGQTGFDSVKYYPLNTRYHANYMASGDIDNDSDNDIVFASNTGNFWGIVYNNYPYGFSEPEYYDIEYPFDINCADMNGDNCDDVIVSSNGIIIFYSHANEFVPDTVYNYGSVEIADFDNDGDNDIISLRNLYISNTARFTLLENMGNENFHTYESLDINPSGFNMEIFDMDNNSLLDIVFTSNFSHFPENTSEDTIGGIYILYNNGDFTLSEPQFISLKNYNEAERKTTCADLDGNNYNDIIITRSGNNLENLEILFNDGNGNFVNQPLSSVPSFNKKEINTGFKLYPNPFTQEISIQYISDKKSISDITIYDFSGRLIKQLKTNNSNLVKWNGTNNNACTVPVGVYFVVIKTEKSIICNKVIKM